MRRQSRRAGQGQHKATVIKLRELVMNARIECDARGCNARAYVTTTLDTGLPLHWCGHHYAEREEDLMPYAIEVHDRRHELHKRPHVDA
jgi:hypothetical protein